MTPASVTASYRNALNIAGESITLRRYTGSGVNRTAADTAVRARVLGYRAEELLGGISQGDRRVIMLVDDLAQAGFALPVTRNDTVIVRGREMQIEDLDDSTRRVRGMLIALELRVRG